MSAEVTGSVHPVVNTHVHLPPNFSAFATVEDAVAAAVSEGVRALGISNFFDQQVYARLAEALRGTDIRPLYGLEFITRIDDLAEAGVRINDPANPGRMYLCGKGIAPFKPKAADAASIAARIRAGNDRRAAEMVARLSAWFTRSGVPNDLSAETIAEDVSRRGNVPVEWVSLQERHIAMAFQEALSGLAEAERSAVLERAYGAPSEVDLNDAVALQGEIRARLIKVGTAGFVPEVPLGFAEAYHYVLAMQGIPTYPTLADGTSPICPFEASPAALATELRGRGIHAAELIPNRNTSAQIDAYVNAFSEAGMIVMAGTEHNTVARIPFQVRAVDGAISSTSMQAFWEGTCVVAAHQYLTEHGRPGYVDADGARTEASVAELVTIGARLIEEER